MRLHPISPVGTSTLGCKVGIRLLVARVDRKVMLTLRTPRIVVCPLTYKSVPKYPRRSPYGYRIDQHEMLYVGTRQTRSLS
jgi:hypothetical protein